MIKVSKSQRAKLEKAGLLKSKRKIRGGGIEDGNYTIVNKYHKGRSKHCYVTETPEIMAFLGMYGENLQIIKPEQLQTLKDKGYVKDTDIQVYGSYTPEATVFIDKDETIRCKRITGYMLALGIWK